MTLRRGPATGAAAAYAKARRPPLSTPWRTARYAVIDLETTGLDVSRDEIISFAAVPIDHGRIVAARALHRLARPARAPAEETIRIHGLRPADLDSAPPLSDVIDDLLHALAGRIVVAHEARIERAFLRPVLRSRGVRLSEPLLDTTMLGALWLFERDGRLPAHLSLTSLVRALELPSHRPHHALGDALTTGQAFLALATHLDRRSPQTVRSLARAPRAVANARYFATPTAS